MPPAPAGGACGGSGLGGLDAPLLSLADSSSTPLLPYEDGFVKLTPAAITLKRYYFPTFQSKTIKVTDIQKARLLPLPSMWTAGYKHWGSSDLVRWWPSDMLRHRRTHFIELDLGVWPTPALTTDRDVQALYTMILQAMEAAKHKQQEQHQEEGR